MSEARPWCCAPQHHGLPGHTVERVEPPPPDDVDTARTPPSPALTPSDADANAPLRTQPKPLSVVVRRRRRFDRMMPKRRQPIRVTRRHGRTMEAVAHIASSVRRQPLCAAYDATRSARRVLGGAPGLQPSDRTRGAPPRAPTLIKA